MSSDNSTTLSPNAKAVRHVLAVGGGRGGVGKSTLSVNLAVYLAQLGRTVVLVDADPAGAELHTLLDVSLPPRDLDPEQAEAQELATLKTQVPGLLLMPQLYSTGSTVPLRPGRKPRWASRLRQLEADYVLLDLGAGTAPSTLDLFLGADLGVLVATPEPPSVETSYRFLKALYQRRIRRALLHDRFKLRLVERAQQGLPPLPSPLELARTIARYDAATGTLVAAELGRLRPRLVINGTRLRADTELGPAMSDMARRYLGVALDFLGHVEHEDAVWLSVVRRRPLLVDSPASKAARNVERIARRVQALVTSRDVPHFESNVDLAGELPNLYDVLGTHRAATDDELRRAHKRQREIFQQGSLALTSLISEEAMEQGRREIEEARDTLIDPLRRRAYDVSMFPDADESHDPNPKQRDGAAEAEREMLREQLAHEISAQTEFSGALLRKVRESLGLEPQEISQRTKISQSYLLAIEQEDFKNLPAMVYTRGFVQEIAKQLKLDPTQVARTYLRRFRRWRAASQDAQD